MEQFSLAMWLVERKLKGIDPPNTLSPEMVPPGNRTVTPSNAVQVRILIKLSYKTCLIHFINTWNMLLLYQ